MLRKVGYDLTYLDKAAAILEILQSFPFKLEMVNGFHLLYIALSSSFASSKSTLQWPFIRSITLIHQWLAATMQDTANPIQRR